MVNSIERNAYVAGLCRDEATKSACETRVDKCIALRDEGKTEFVLGDAEKYPNFEACLQSTISKTAEAAPVRQTADSEEYKRCESVEIDPVAKAACRKKIDICVTAPSAPIQLPFGNSFVSCANKKLCLERAPNLSYMENMGRIQKAVDEKKCTFTISTGLIFRENETHVGNGSDCVKIEKVEKEIDELSGKVAEEPMIPGRGWASYNNCKKLEEMMHKSSLMSSSVSTGKKGSRSIPVGPPFLHDNCEASRPIPSENSRKLSEKREEREELIKALPKQ